MKKYIIFAATIFVVATACQKENTSPSSQAANTILALESSNPVPPQNVEGRLIFNSEEHFLATINALDHGHANLNTWEDGLNFISVRRINESLYENHEFELLPFADEYFATVLNARCVIQVGDWVFKLHPSIRKILALHISNIGKFPVLDDDAIIPDPDIHCFDIINSSNGELLTTHVSFDDDDGKCWNLYRGTRCLRNYTASATVVWRDACTKANNTTGRTYTLTMDNLGTIVGF